jgi:uncharacterized protein YqeY
MNMDLFEQISNDIKEAMKAKDKVKLEEELDELEKKINKEKKENSWFDLFAKKVTNLSDEILKDN